MHTRPSVGTAAEVAAHAEERPCRHHSRTCPTARAANYTQQDHVRREAICTDGEASKRVTRIHR